MTVLHDIIPQLHKLSFEYYDTNKLRDMDGKNYMKVVRDMPDSLNRFVAMKWEKGLEQSGLLSLLFMPHFGQST